MMGATLVHSPGYQVPLWLGPAQLRLWRRLDRTIGGRTFASTTVRALAGELGTNPGTISRDLDALARLGFAVHLARWGRAGVTLWRVVSPGGRRGLDPRRQRRALARMGLSRVAPGQLALVTIQATDPADDPPASGPSPTAAPIPPGAAVNPEPGGDTGAAAGPFDTIRCSCGRSRLVANGRELAPCPHPPTTRSTLGLDP